MFVVLPLRAAAAETARRLPGSIPASVVLYPDQGRLELAGDHLLGLRLRWESASVNGAHVSGADVCLEPTPVGKHERCAFSIPRTLPPDAGFAWAPVLSFGAAGAAAEQTAGFSPLHPARVVLDPLLPASATPSI